MYVLQNVALTMELAVIKVNITDCSTLNLARSTSEKGDGQTVNFFLLSGPEKKCLAE